MANEVTDRITVGVPWSEEAGSGGGIQEVNGYTGPSVQLDASDVGAVPDNQFASTAQRGIVQIATSAQALAGTNSQNAVTPSALRAALMDRHERSATTVAALGAGRYPGETALLIISDMRLLIFWNGLAWRPASMSLAGTAIQQGALTGQGIIPEGLEWRDTGTGDVEIYSGSTWVPVTQPGHRVGTSTERSAETPRYGDTWQDTDGLKLLWIGSSFSSWRRKTGVVPVGAAAWTSSQPPAYGRTISTTIPTVIEESESVLITPVAIGSGYGALALVSHSIGGSSASLSIRHMGFLSSTTQAVSFAWEIMPGAST